MATTASPAYWGTVLQNGSSGPDVALVQRWLNSAHDRWPAIPRLRVDGRFGPSTANAVRTFQILTGLSNDSEVGRNTWNELFARYAQQGGSGGLYPGMALRSGSRGAAVRSAQAALRAIVPGLATDGRFGPATRRAVEAFQLTHGLTADGVIGPRTWAALFGG